MPQELAGFYYDSEKNRYFPIKGPIPGSARKPPPKPDHHQEEDNEPSTSMSSRKQTRTAELLHSRELCGKTLSAKGSKLNFQHEYQKMQASQPVIWKYEGMERMADSDLEQLCFDMQTPEGQKKTNFLLMGSMSGSFSLYEVGQVGEHFNNVVERMPDPIWPPITEKQAECIRIPRRIWSPLIAPILMPSDVSSIKVPGKHSSYTDDAASIQHAVISTLGSETSGGSVYILKLSEPLDDNLMRRIFEVASLNCTIWTAECHPDGVQVVLGTNRGAALLNLETGVVSWLCHSKSAIFSQQFDQSGNVILCGFRNGAIVTVDVRQKQQGFPSVLYRHRIPFPSKTSHEQSRNNAQKRTKGCFELKGSIHPSCTIFMPSSISSLMSLQTDDQYFLASSMDGSIKLYDHRLIQRGAIQSYEGHVNSHTRIQMGVDPSERLMMSGGEDGKVRIWSIKTGELLFGTKISNSVPTTVCWPGIETDLQGMSLRRHIYGENLYQENHSWGAWLGSAEGLFYIHGS